MLFTRVHDWQKMCHVPKMATSIPQFTFTSLKPKQYTMKNNNVSKFIAIFFALSVLSACGPKRDDGKKQAEEQNDDKFKGKMENDAEFAVEAADGGMLEVRLGRLALTNSNSAKVKQFGQMMIDDHSKAGEELQNLARSKNISLPSALSNKCQKKYDDLAGKKGEDFDKAYSKLMVKDHEDDVDKFKKEGEKGVDADIKSWAAAKVTTLEHHLQAAREMDEAVRK
jgi:putative membrane protein